jgi:hypothetical protein
MDILIRKSKEYYKISFDLTIVFNEKEYFFYVEESWSDTNTNSMPVISNNTLMTKENRLTTSQKKQIRKEIIKWMHLQKDKFLTTKGLNIE